jgi:hypothetical protein
MRRVHLVDDAQLIEPDTIRSERWKWRSFDAKTDIL